MTRHLKQALGLLLALASAAPAAHAQFARGNVYGNVTDESGAVLPGATATLTGASTAPLSTVAGSKGEFLFLNLDPGAYRLEVALTGFGTQARELTVSAGTNVELTFGLKVSSVQETVTVTGEQPVIDTKKVGTATTLSREELAQIPNARDPWAVLRTVPGVNVDRMNIAGNESGQQANFAAKGAAFTDTMWNLDGVTITDTTAAGASPTYFDYDAFDEIAVTTGGSDLKVQTGGLGLNFVTKRGTNAFHGSLRGYFTHDDFQSSNLPDELVGDPRLDGSDKASHIAQISDYGFDLGGPIVKDKLWFYGSWGRQDIRNVRLNQTNDKTVLTSINGKLNWQASPNDSVSLFWFNGIKEKLGRSVLGATGTEEDSFLGNQSQAYQHGFPHGLTKLEWNRVFGPNFVLNTKLAYYDVGFILDPRGGRDLNALIDFTNDVSKGSSLYVENTRPQYSAYVDGSYFRSATGGNHEFRFGFSYRKTPTESITAWNGNKVYAVRFNTGAPGIDGVAGVTRDKNAAYHTSYTSGYVGDTFSRGRLTVNGGLRFDHQTGANDPSVVPANPIYPELLPAIDYAGGGQGITWNDLSPRIGLTYALSDSKRTIVRASYARYAGQLTAADVSWDNPVGAGYSYLGYLWSDHNGDGFVQRDEVLTDFATGANYVDPANPGSTVSPNTIDPGYGANHDDEYIFGVEHQIGGDLAVSATYTHRRSTDLAWTPRIGLTSADYFLSDQATIDGYTAVAFAPDPDKVAAGNFGRILQNRPDYSRSFDGVELVLNKRLSRRWMLRSAVSYNDWKENVGPGGVQNPMRIVQGAPQSATERSYSGPQVDGGQYAPASGGSGKGNVFINAKWQFVTNAIYQIGAGFEVSGALYGRQGNPYPVVISLDAGYDGAPAQVLAVPNMDTERYADVWDLDLRLAKNIRLGGGSFVLTADAFNVFNSNVVLDRTRTAETDSFRTINEVLNPRIFRFGVRFNF